MKISTVGFYYDFTRFFAALHLYNLSDSKVIVKNYATHFSGYIFENSKGMERVFLPTAVRICRERCDIPQDKQLWVCEYLTKSGVIVSKAIEVAYIYLAYFMKEFAINPPDVLIISGDTRLQSRAALVACKLLKIRYYCFEQGPFGTTILDPEGVNCTASFAHKFLDIKATKADAEIVDDYIKLTKNKFVERRIVRALDYFTQPFLLVFGCIEIREEKKLLRQIWRYINSLIKFKDRKIISDIPDREPFVLVIGQVPTDANFSLYSQYRSTKDFMLDVEGLFLDINIVFREHPLFTGSYGKDLYAHINMNSRLSFSQGESLDWEVSEAKYIVVVNSTVGMEVLLKHRKPLLCLGDASYSHLNGVYHRDCIGKFLESEQTIGNEEHYENSSWFLSSFIMGHFRDSDLSKVCSEVMRVVNES